MSDEVKERLFRVLRWLGVVGLLALSGGLVYWIFYASLNAEMFPSWTGFNTRDAPDDTYSARTLWDWLSLLLVPVVLAVGGLLFTWFENRQTRVIERERVAENQRIERERAQDGIVKDYLDQMTELLLNYALRDSSEGDEVRSVGRSRTLTALYGVEGNRKATIMQFLYESRLIGYVGDSQSSIPIIDLDGANLIGAYLEGLIFTQARLKKVNLSGACLYGIKMNDVDLRGANLNGAILTRAYVGGGHFEDAHLERATLDEGYFFGAHFVSSNLSRARLEKVVFVRANLSGAYFRDAHLEGAIFTEARLVRSNLSGAYLGGACFKLADLSKCVLVGCKGITPDQLLQAESLHGAILPDYINPAYLGDKWSPPKDENTSEP